jgi:hypothetical protein
VQPDFTRGLTSYQPRTTMESLNLHTLANSLPTAQQNAEKELLNDFKAAALSITTLYRSSRKNSKRAYNAGYASACQDLLNFIQQGVSADVGQSRKSSNYATEGGSMTIGRVMDWTEARLDAIRAREEEEDEDEEREKDKDRASGSPPRPSIVAPSGIQKTGGKKHQGHASCSSINQPKDGTISLPTPNSPVTHINRQLHSVPSSPSPPPPNSTSRPGRQAKSRPLSTIQPTSSTVLSEPFASSNPSIPFPETPIVIGTGAKRRHAVMMMLDSGSPAISIGSQSSNVSSPGGIVNNNGTTYTNGERSSKRRTRRNHSQLQTHNPNISLIQRTPEAMDVEEDGRERKRVARR